MRNFNVAAWVVSVALSTLCLGGGQLHAANIVIDPGVGFDDVTATTPIGGNTGLTRGAQRLMVFERAAEIWGSRLESSETIIVEASFAPLTCAGNSATLGSAGPETFFLYTDTPPPGALTFRIYPVALFNALDSADNNGVDAEIIAEFNSAIDTGCFNGGTWYYGIDDSPPPPNMVPLLPVVLHEMGHGLGFLSTACASDTDCGTCTNPSGCGDGIGNGDPIPPGARLGGFADMWDLFLFDEETGELWDDMTLSERGVSLVNDPDVTWTGPEVDARTPTFQPGGQGLHATSGNIRMYAPNPQEPGSSISHFTEDASAPNLLMEPVLQSGVFDSPDLTTALLRDIGWQTAAGGDDPNFVFGNGFE